MTLVNLPSIQNGDEASDTLFNARFGALAAVLNGGIDQENLADNAVSTSKIANLAVTPAKMGLTKVVDANGWTVYDYGSWKEYHKRFAVDAGLIGVNGTWTMASSQPFPAGKNESQLHVLASHALSGNSPFFNLSLEYGGNSTTFTIYAQNTRSDTAVDPGAGYVYVMCKDL